MIRLRVWWWRWVIPVFACLQLITTAGMLYNYSILFVSLQKEFDSGAVLAGWPGSLANGLSCLLSPLTSLLTMRMKTGKVIILAHVVICVGYLLTSIVPALGYAVFTFGVMGGVGASSLIHPVLRLVLEWFPKDNYSRANGIALMGDSLGMLVYSPLITACITRFGWRRALRYISVGQLAIGIMASLFMTDPPTENEGNNEGGDEGQPGADERERITLETVDLDHTAKRTVVEEDLGEGKKPRQEPRIQKPSYKSNGGCFADWEVCQMITRIDPWTWTVGVCLAMVGWTFFGINFASFMDGLGLSSDRIAVVIMFFAIGEISGKVLVIVVGDHLPFQRIYFLVASAFLGTVALGVMTAVQTYPQMMAVSICSGFVRSLIYGHVNPAAADIFFQTYTSSGVVILARFPFGLGVLLGAPLSGGLYDITGDYTLSLVVIAAIFFCAAIAFLTIVFHQKCASRDCCCFSSENRPVLL